MSRFIKLNNIKIGKGSKYVFEDLEDISSGSITEQEDNYYNSEGAEYGEIYFEPRVFAVTGTIIAESKEELNQLKLSLIAECNPKNAIDVFYFNGINTYYAKAKANGCIDFGKIIPGSWYLPFSISIKIPSFYWESEFELSNLVYGAEGRLNKNFSFPGVFSVRTSRGIIKNESNVDIFPKIEITGTGQNPNIQITNHTTNKNLIIEHIVTAGEIVTVDMWNCDVVSSVHGSIINKIDAINDFWSLVPGDNDIEVVSVNITATMKYRNKFIGV